jgi:3-oxoacyl-[acyl-carrier-protein] synthase II
MGTINPLGKSVDEFWNGIKENKIGYSFIDTFDTSNFDIKIAGLVRDFDCTQYGIDKKEAKRLERFNQFSLVATQEALKDCGTDFKDLDPYRVGVIVGCGVGGLILTENELSKYWEKGASRVSPFYIPMQIINMCAGTISIKTGFKGSNFALATACASSTHSIGEGFRKIKDGYLDAVVCGGTESCISEFTLAGFNNMKALTRCNNLEKASIPFDKDRSGFVMGEGSGMVILEELEHAKARGAKIYAEVVGYGATCDAYHMTSPAPDGEGAGTAMKLAIAEGGVSPEEVDYINAHGTSTGLNDKYETTAIKYALGEDNAKKVKINSTKSMIGHLLGGAGAVEAIVTAKSIQEGLVHATVGTTQTDEDCDLDYCIDGNVEMDVNCALSNSLGFGGHNATICLKKYVG